MCGPGWKSTDGCRDTRAPWKPGHVCRTPQNTVWFLTSSCRVGPSPVSTQARQRLPPWIPRKMGTLVRSRPLLGSMQIFSGRKERREPGDERTQMASSQRAKAGQERAGPGRTWPDPCIQAAGQAGAPAAVMTPSEGEVLICSLPLLTVTRGRRGGESQSEGMEAIGSHLRSCCPHWDLPPGAGRLLSIVPSDLHP